ncbi:unnamed protein product, partial [Allacma fusca]
VRLNKLNVRSIVKILHSSINLVKVQIISYINYFELDLLRAPVLELFKYLASARTLDN